MNSIHDVSNGRGLGAMGLNSMREVIIGWGLSIYKSGEAGGVIVGNLGAALRRRRQVSGICCGSICIRSRLWNCSKASVSPMHARQNSRSFMIAGNNKRVSSMILSLFHTRPVGNSETKGL